VAARRKGNEKHSGPGGGPPKQGSRGRQQGKGGCRHGDLGRRPGCQRSMRFPCLPVKPSPLHQQTYSSGPCCTQPARSPMGAEDGCVTWCLAVTDLQHRASGTGSCAPAVAASRPFAMPRAALPASCPRLLEKHRWCLVARGVPAAKGRRESSGAGLEVSLRVSSQGGAQGGRPKLHYCLWLPTYNTGTHPGWLQPLLPLCRGQQLTFTVPWPPTSCSGSVARSQRAQAEPPSAATSCCLPAAWRRSKHPARRATRGFRGMSGRRGARAAAAPALRRATMGRASWLPAAAGCAMPLRSARRRPACRRCPCWGAKGVATRAGVLAAARMAAVPGRPGWCWRFTCGLRARRYTCRCCMRRHVHGMLLWKGNTMRATFHSSALAVQPALCAQTAAAAPPARSRRFRGWCWVRPRCCSRSARSRACCWQSASCRAASAPSCVRWAGRCSSDPRCRPVSARGGTMASVGMAAVQQVHW
jgi:hypothetical protein